MCCRGDLEHMINFVLHGLLMLTAMYLLYYSTFRDNLENIRNIAYICACAYVRVCIFMCLFLSFL